MKHFFVAITSCPSGIAHTYMAARSLEDKGAELGYDVRVETEGSGGSKDILTEQEIREADAVIIAADVRVDLSRFVGKKLLMASTQEAIKKAPELFARALSASEHTEKSSRSSFSGAKEKKQTGFYKHLMTGVSYMLPVVVAGGLLIALAFAFGGIYAGDARNAGSFAFNLMQIGSTAFKLFVPVLGAYIAFSIAGRPGITPGIVGGALAATVGAGFLGAIIAGFFAGYLTYWLNRLIKLPQTLEGLKPVFILPLLTTFIVGLGMIYLIGPPVKWLLTWLTAALQNLQGSGSLILGFVLGAMMATDMGGPINKAAYAFSVALLSSRVYQPMAAVMAAGMTPPLALACAGWLFKNRFTQDELQARPATALMGLSFITEGAIPYASRDPFRVIPALMLGSGTAGALSMVMHVKLLVPHGGIFVLLIPKAVSPLLIYVIALAVGTAVSTAALYFFKRPIKK